MNIIKALLVIYLIYQILGMIWRKKHPKYDITFIAAEIGAGKSCYAAKLVKRHLKKGWKVYSNDFVLGAGRINVKQLETMCAPEKSLIILDEASLDMNSRNFAKTALVLIEYFKMSRHYKNKLVLISQTFSDTDKQIRDLAARILFIRPIFADSFPGLVSMPVRVRGHLGIALDGQPAMQYKIGRVGVPYLLPLYYKYFSSFSRVERPHIPWVEWVKEQDRKSIECKKWGRGVAPNGGTPADGENVTQKRFDAARSGAAECVTNSVSESKM
ncbi:MAG TPA: hypothetical protein DDZ89_00890 [Clostridiales bacterium]|nr:hypothetical protein [Clostridiales bacterium]